MDHLKLDLINPTSPLRQAQAGHLDKRWFSQCSIGIAQDEELLRLASRSGCRALGT